MRMKEFEMSETDLSELMERCKAVPLIALNCGMPKSPQENANNAWNDLGEKLGFKPMTVEPIPSKGERFFLAEPTYDMKPIENLMDEFINKLDAVKTKPLEGGAAINIILDCSDSQSPIFVEIENDNGESVSIGEYIARSGGLWSIRITSRNMVEVEAVAT